MLRAAGSTALRRAALSASSRGAPSCAVPRTMAFHASSKREEEAKAPVATAPVDSGFLGTGLSQWFALPVGITAAIPLIQYEWYIINEETQLAACFIAFCVALYKQGGDAIYDSLKVQADGILKEHKELEDELVASIESKKEIFQLTKDIVQDYRQVNVMREEAYANLNEAGAIKPLHDFKGQMERALNMIVQEEASVAEKTKVALMQEATETVTKQFTSSKALKKAALDAAIASMKGQEAAEKDPVRSAFVKFFKDKAAAVKKADDGSEEKAQREALVAKINAVAKAEGFFFDIDAATGTPKMVA